MISEEEMRAWPRSRLVAQAARDIDQAIATLQEDGGAYADVALDELRSAREHVVAALDYATKHDRATNRIR